VTFVEVQQAYERWILARTALTAGSRTNPAPEHVAVEARAAFAAYWEIAGAYEREHPELVGFRSRFPGWWAEGAATGAIVDAHPPPHVTHGALTKAERDRRRKRSGS
jgi:hypothetical protein